MYWTRVSALALGGGCRKKCTLIQPCSASQSRFGSISIPPKRAARTTPRVVSTSLRQTTNAATSTTSTTASVYFVSKPTPTATPSVSQEPRPSASRSASQSTSIVAAWSNETGWNKPFATSRPGENATATAAITCARRPPPSSRATSAANTTVTAPARIAKARKPTNDRPNSPWAAADSSAATG